jgi:hypothetical protein
MLPARVRLSAIVLHTKKGTTFWTDQRGILTHFFADLLRRGVTLRAIDLGRFTGQKLQSIEE